VLRHPVQLEASVDGGRTLLRRWWGSAQLCFHVQPGNYDTDSLIGVLKELGSLLGYFADCAACSVARFGGR
jgi:hypothetical protein